jgi:hypothetical protein
MKSRGRCKKYPEVRMASFEARTTETQGGTGRNLPPLPPPVFHPSGFISPEKNESYSKNQFIFKVMENLFFFHHHPNSDIKRKF